MSCTINYGKKKQARFISLALVLVSIFLIGCNNTNVTSTPTVTPTLSDILTGTPSFTPETSGGEITFNPEMGAIEELGIYPVPQKVELLKEGAVFKLSGVSLSKGAEKYKELVEEFVTIESSFSTELDIVINELSDVLGENSKEGYILEITGDKITITAENEKGVFYSLKTLSALMQKDENIPFVKISDAPANPVRGVIEGFYGAAWSHDFRLKLFDFMGDTKMNSYFYAPKDDSKHRSNWREKYTAKELETLEELTDRAQKNFVSFVYCISPGLDIDLGSGYEADLEKLMDKCGQLYDIGVRDFAVFLDDISSRNAQGHAKLLNDFQEKFIKTHDGANDLITVAPEYATTMYTPGYTDSFAKELNKDISVMWTGMDIIPKEITTESLEKFTDIYGRKLLIWWNYPTNDYSGNSLFMGETVRLDKELNEYTTGIVSNPMNQGNASIVPIFTMADYAWNPEKYNSSESLSAAVSYYMPEAPKELRLFIELTSACTVNNHTDSVYLKSLLDDYASGITEKKLAKLIMYFENIQRAAESIEIYADKAFLSEIKPWLEKFKAYGEMGKAFFEMEKEYLENGKLTDNASRLASDYTEAYSSIKDNQSFVSTRVFALFISYMNSRIKVILGESEKQDTAYALPYSDCKHYGNYTLGNMTDGNPNTYFFSDGNLYRSSGNILGYVGLDLGYVTDINSIFILSGNGDSDVLRDYVLEYSSDGTAWQTIKEGKEDEIIKLDNLSLKGRYIRVRCKNNSSEYWVKIREFQVNSNISDAPIRPAVVPSGNLPVYQSYTYDKMTDGDPSTYLWVSALGKAGDYFRIDLGDVLDVTNITFNSGVTAHPDDKVDEGKLSYSLDGESWTDIGVLENGKIDIPVDITARYLRVTVTKNQNTWITVSEFSAVVK